MPAVTVAVAPLQRIRIDLPGGVKNSLEGWSVYDSDLGTIYPQEDGSWAIYQHGNKVGIQRVVYGFSGVVGIVNVVSIVPHDHSDMYRGGPAFGVYKSDLE